MKKLLLLIAAVICFSNIAAQTTKYNEINTGFSTGVVPLFPGMSYMTGATTKYPSGILLDYEGGFALPSIVTGKIGVGVSLDEYIDLYFGVRPWPSSTYAQLNIRRPGKPTNIVVTAENMLWSKDTWAQYAIFTVGWRRNK